VAVTRVIVVGAGPAGVRAAEALVAAGLRPVVIDEARRDGGQIYRRQPDGFFRAYPSLYGTEAARAQALHQSFGALRGRMEYYPDTLAWNVADGHLHLLETGRSFALPFDALIIAAGATDRVMPMRGWTLPGVYSLGAAQIALKSQACAIGRRVVFLGTGPLLYLVAAQYLKAGATVAAVLDTSAFARRLRALPKLLARPGTLAKGLALVAALRRSGAALATGVTPVEISGDPQAGVSGISVRDRAGVLRRFDCDAAALGYHLRPETQLADLAHCEFRFDADTRQWLPQVDADGRSSVAGVYLAGDGARILGADGAEAAGRLAALAALRDAGHSVSADELARLRRTLAQMDRFRLGLAEAFPWPSQAAAQLPDDTIVCRCEGIDAGELRRVTRDMGASEVNRAKAFSRVGMGRCQGRYCGHAAAEIVAAAAGTPLERVGRLRSQAPVKPLPIATETVDA
jgi:NADPH-dependent 2,4-dienoyl-CoA reductase/sulfur reductase-like enzyme